MEEKPPVREPKGWYSRGYLPHIDLPNLTQFVTFRLHDSVPQNIWEKWHRELAHLPEKERRKRQEILCSCYADLGVGECWLKMPSIAQVVEDALLHFHGVRYELLAWTIMPNHVHCLARLGETAALSETIRTIKGYSAKEANRLLGRRGSFWARDYFDRYIRNGEHFANVVRYIDRNPVKARLCSEIADWPFGSARFRSLADRNVGIPSQASLPSAPFGLPQ